MVLHLLPVSDYLPDREPIEEEEIRLLATAPKPKPPLMRDWIADNDSQTIIHVATGCMFRAYPVPMPLVSGLRVPFGPTHEIAVKFSGMKNIAACPAPEEIRELGRQGIEWIRTYTFEAHKA